MRAWGQIILIALDWVDRVVRKERARKRANRVEDIRRNPADEFDRKFGRVPNKPTAAPMPSGKATDDSG